MIRPYEAFFFEDTVHLLTSRHKCRDRILYVVSVYNLGIDFTTPADHLDYDIRGNLIDNNLGSPSFKDYLIKSVIPVYLSITRQSKRI